MRIFLISLVAVLLMCSCKKETTYQMRILIKNNTDSKLKVTLFPKSAYMHGDLYDFDDIGSGYRGTIFDLDTNDQETFYTSGNLDQKPYDLTSKIFDSIHITPYDQPDNIIRFSNNAVIGYSDNLFSDNSTWVYELKNFSEKTNFSSHPFESHDYIFEIVP